MDWLVYLFFGLIIGIIITESVWLVVVFWVWVVGYIVVAAWQGAQADKKAKIRYNQQTQEKAREYREAAQESAKAFAEDGFDFDFDFDFDQEIAQEFNPPEKFKKLYRDAVKLIHPDLTMDEKERERRHHIMVNVNQAYKDGDAERLRQIVHQWEGRPESVEGESGD